MQNNKTIIISLGVLLLLIVAVTYLLVTRSSSEEVVVGDDNSEFTSVSGDEKNSIIVNDQIPGNTVFFQNLTLEEDGFVIVREDENGEPGDVIGSLFLESGADQNGNIELDRPTVEGGMYYIELFADTDSNGEFDESLDTAVLTTLGSRVQVRIKTTENLPEIKG